MSELDHILAHNRQFVAEAEYSQYFTNKYPQRHLAVLGCMDARMMELLPQAMGLKNGDAKLIKNAGASVTHLWGSVMRSLLIAVYELDVREIMVVAHHDCGMLHLNATQLLQRAQTAGIPADRIELLRNAGIDLDEWLQGFDCVEESVRHTVAMIRKHPLMPETVLVHGLVIHPRTGRLEVVLREQDA